MSKMRGIKVRISDEDQERAKSAISQVVVTLKRIKKLRKAMRTHWLDEDDIRSLDRCRYKLVKSWISLQQIITKIPKTQNREVRQSYP